MEEKNGVIHGSSSGISTRPTWTNREKTKRKRYWERGKMTRTLGNKSVRYFVPQCQRGEPTRERKAPRPGRDYCQMNRVSVSFTAQGGGKS